MQGISQNADSRATEGVRSLNSPSVCCPPRLDSLAPSSTSTSLSPAHSRSALLLYSQATISSAVAYNDDRTCIRSSSPRKSCRCPSVGRAARGEGVRESSSHYSSAPRNARFSLKSTDFYLHICTAHEETTGHQTKKGHLLGSLARTSSGDGDEEQLRRGLLFRQVPSIPGSCAPAGKLAR